MNIESSNEETVVATAVSTLSHVIFTVIDNYKLEVDSLRKQLNSTILERNKLQKELETLKSSETHPLDEK